MRLVRVMLRVTLIALTLGVTIPRVLAYWSFNRASVVLDHALLQADQIRSGRVQRLQYAKLLMQGWEARDRSKCDAHIANHLFAIQLALQEYPVAIAELKHWLEICPDDNLVQFKLGQAYHAEGQWGEAALSWQRAGAWVPLRELGNTLAQQRKWAEALLAYQAFLEWQPDDCVYRVRAGNAMWWGKRDLEGAMEQFLQAVDLCPDLLEGYVSVSRVLIEAKRYSEAERWARLGREIEPASEVPLSVLALIELRQGRVAEALVFLQEAMSLNPTSAEVYALQGSAYIQMGQLEQAVRALNEAACLGPAQAWIYDLLGGAYEKLGEHVNAMIAYQKALELDPARESVRDRLQQLQGSE